MERKPATIGFDLGTEEETVVHSHCSLNLPITKQITNQLASSLSKQKDDICKFAISKYFGTEDWDIEQIAKDHDFKLITTINPKTETFTIDGTEIIRFYGTVESEVEDEGEKVMMSASFKYQILI